MFSAKQTIWVNGGAPCSFTNQPSNRPHLHLDYMEICFVLHGQGLYNHGGKEYPLSQDTLFISHLGIIHEISSWETRNLEIFFVTLTDFSKESSHNPPLAVCLNHCPQLRDYIPLIQRHSRSPSVGTGLAREGFAREALELLSLEKESLSTFSDNPGELLFITDYIEENIHLPLAVQTLAEQFSQSERTLRRQFSRVTGIGLKQYILQRKIERAANLLMMHWRVNEAARAVGMNDPAQFSRTFKALKGESPPELAEPVY
jgi:AraC-like DNA-binding protein